MTFKQWSFRHMQNTWYSKQQLGPDWSAVQCREYTIPWLINPYNYLKSKIIPTCKQNLGILHYLVSLQSSKVAETNAKRTCSRRREHCYDDQANQDPKDAKHSTQNKLGGFVSIAENWRDTENSIQQINANFVWDSDLG